LSGVIPGLSGVMAGAATALAGIAALVFAQLQKEKERVEQLMTSFGDALSGLYDQGIMVADKLAREKAMADWIEQNIDGFGAMQDELDLVGIKMEDYVGTIAAGGAPLDDMIGQLEDTYEKEKAIHGESDGRVRALEDLVNETKNFKDESEKVAEKQSLIAGSVQSYRDNIDGISKIDIDKGLPNTVTDSAKVKENLQTVVKDGVKIPVSFYTTGKPSPAAAGGGWSGYGPQPGPNAATTGTAPYGAPTGGQQTAYITHNWNVTVNARTPDPTATVRAIEKYARDNGRPTSVNVTV
jgi:hypothetical protein